MRNSCAAYAPELQRISRTQKVECSPVETCSCCTVLIVCLYSPKRHVTLGFEVTTPPKITDLGHVRNAVPHMRNWCGAYAKHVGHTSVFSCFSRFRQPKPIYLLWVIIVVYFSPSEIRLQQSDIDL